MSILYFFRTLAFSVSFIAGIEVATSSCTTTATTDPVPTNDKGQLGYVIGKVTDPGGMPLPKATVYIENTVFKGRGSEITSSADGSYKMAVVAGLGQWVARGYILKAYNDRVYKLLLHPENADSFTQEEKPVRNFQWKLQGHVPDLSLNMYYGGSAELYKDPNEEGLVDSENIEFTFQPDGPLIDGSQGKILKLRCGAAGSQNRNVLNDIPIGRYKVSAVYLPTGKPLRVKDAWTDGAYQTVMRAEFIGTESSYRTNQMGIGFRE